MGGFREKPDKQETVACMDRADAGTLSRRSGRETTFEAGNPAKKGEYVQ